MSKTDCINFESTRYLKAYSTYVFTCRNCGISIMSDRQPSNSGCVAARHGKGGSHNWARTRL